jgi:transcriptional regulator with XRE-family HTH domain
MELDQDEAPVNRHRVEIGMRIRRARLQRGLLAADLARRAGISPSFLSQVESGAASPSLKVLQALASGLDVSAAALLEDDGQPPVSVPPDTRLTVPAEVTVVRADRRKVLRMADGPEYQLLSPDLTGRIELILVEFEPGEGSPVDAFVHPGEEQLVVLDGRMVYEIDGVEYALERGDSIRFDSGLPHRAHNPGPDRAVTIAAITPPSF